MANEKAKKDYISFFDLLYIKHHTTGELSKFCPNESQRRFLGLVMQPRLRTGDVKALRSRLVYLQGRIKVKSEAARHYDAAEIGALKRALALLGHDDSIKSAADSLVTDSKEGETE